MNSLSCLTSRIVSHRHPGTLILALIVSVGLAGCRRSDAPTPPVATPTVTLSRTMVPLGAPVDVTFRFVVAADAPAFTENNRVFVHVVDTDEKLMWTEDHDPPTPTTEWKPGQTVEYVRTMFIPVRPYIGGASIHVGLYSPASQQRLTMSGHDSGQHSYNVATLEILPQSEAVFTVLKDGWHSAETPPNNDQVEWSWTSKNQATIAFKNPKKDAIFYLDLDNPSGIFPEGQHVQVTLGAKTVDDFVLHPARQLRKIAIPGDAFGSEEMVELKVGVDKVFVPAQVNPAGSRDGRQLGVRVFHAVITPQ
ncbi:MAG: hypothetical protein ABI868_20810 [Acidobacteriota bacterium]